MRDTVDTKVAKLTVASRCDPLGHDFKGDDRESPTGARVMTWWPKLTEEQLREIVRRCGARVVHRGIAFSGSTAAAPETPAGGVREILCVNREPSIYSKNPKP
ncbi:MAG: hypothetical protein HY323_01045 [Betaproteobacteria bacterium]|nr:hypothetical protein [Betaproteobacteria bacterium]